ncbi:glycosyltransferase family 2 protein [Thioclava sp.]|uniref:glycosyltransferase family 2 protein n=1 Tax=Thioclava sp. TaxID=1933450 RepID=UPI003AA99F45
MDNAQTMNEPVPIAERPLVTFALFAYNQEKYIREAVEGAFSQTYEPLEIILSDDCSTDRTFEVMQEMAAAYEGPHKVIVRQNSFNLGTALHVQLAFNESSGVLFVVAAGDDVSVPERVMVLVTVWDTAGRPEGALHSGRITFREGEIAAHVPAKRNRHSDRLLKGYAEACWLPAAAPTCAYTRGVFERFGPLLGGSIIEDVPLQLRAALIGSFLSCDQPLVRQRQHDNNTGTGYGINSPARWNRFLQSKIIAFRTMQSDLARSDGEIDEGLRSRIEFRILAVLHSASGLILPENRSLNRLERVRLVLRMLSAPAVASRFRVRAEYVLDFLGFEFHQRLKIRLRMLISNSWRP